MLNKLLKYEGKATAKILLPAGAGVLGMSVLSALMRVITEHTLQNDTANFLYVLVTAAAGLCVAAVLLGCVFVNTKRFYDLFGDAGYTMLALPVPTWQHMAAKLICAVGWTVLGLLWAGACFVLMTGAPIGEAVNVWLISGSQRIPVTNVGCLLLGLLFVLVCMVLMYLMLYLSCAIGGQFNQNRMVASIAAYFVTGFILQFLTIAAMIFAAIAISKAPGVAEELSAMQQNVNYTLINKLLAGLTAGAAALCAAVWALTWHLMSKKLNLA